MPPNGFSCACWCALLCLVGPVYTVIVGAMLWLVKCVFWLWLCMVFVTGWPGVVLVAIVVFLSFCWVFVGVAMGAISVLFVWHAIWMMPPNLLRAHW